MEQRIVLQSEKKYIYFISDSDVNFYLIIPRCQKVSLVLKLVYPVDDNVVQGISDVDDKVIIVPILSNELLNGLMQNHVDSFNAVDTIFSNALNLAHRILTYNHLEVDMAVYFDENTNYSTFHSWFIQKYGGRVLSIQLSPQKVSDSSLEHHQELDTTTSLEQQNQTVPTSDAKNDNVDEEVDVQLSQSQLPEGKDFGFVSYVLLGVVVAVVSLLFLYFIL